jgi:3-oxoacyl-[acyl-carrier protein] reductase
MRLKDKVAIVTGGAKGLGRAFALKMAEEGARVMVVTRKDMDNLKETVKGTSRFVSSRRIPRNRYPGYGQRNC